MRNQAIAAAKAVREPFVEAEALIADIIRRGDGASTGELALIQTKMTRAHSALNAAAAMAASLFSEEVRVFSGGGDKNEPSPNEN